RLGVAAEAERTVAAAEGEPALEEGDEVGAVVSIHFLQRAVLARAELLQQLPASDEERHPSSIYVSHRHILWVATPTATAPPSSARLAMWRKGRRMRLGVYTLVAPLLVERLLPLPYGWLRPTC